MGKHLIAAGILLGSAMGAAHAANMSFLNNSILLHIPKAQVQTFSAEVGRVLSDVPDGQSATWTSQAANRRQVPVSVTMVPRSTTKTSKGQTCRFLESQVSQAGASENWKFWFCREGDSGPWRASAQ